MSRHLLLNCVAVVVCSVLSGVSSQALADDRRVPVIEQPWIRITGNPDLGELTSDKQQPVDFGVWQASDGSWQLWSCIRKTKEVGRPRLLYRWEGKSLTSPDWTPKGIAMRADPTKGELPGGLQAPHVVQQDGQYVMFYGSWDDICSAVSADGKTFTRRTNSAGKTPLFRGTELEHPRDAMLISINGLWHCYYTAHSATKDIGKAYCRTSKDLVHWGDEHLVAAAGRSGAGKYSAECPFVVELEPGEFYLFRTQKYGKEARTCVYHSNDPLNFGVDNDKGHFVCELPVAAPEIVRLEGQYYIVALRPGLDGIQVAPLKWK